MKRQARAGVVIFAALLSALSLPAIPACGGGVGGDNDDDLGFCSSGYVGKPGDLGVSAWYQTLTDVPFTRAKLIEPTGVEHGMSVGDLGGVSQYALYADVLAAYPSGRYKIVIDGKEVFSEKVPSKKPVKAQFLSPAPGSSFSVSAPPTIQWKYPTPTAGEAVPDNYYLQVTYGTTLIEDTPLSATKTHYKIPAGLDAGGTLTITVITSVGNFMVISHTNMPKCGQRETFWSESIPSLYIGIP